MHISRNLIATSDIRFDRPFTDWIACIYVFLYNFAFSHGGGLGFKSPQAHQ